jgi:hypothetical protein
MLDALGVQCWDKTAVKVVLQHGVIPLVLEYLQAADQEVRGSRDCTLTAVNMSLTNYINR